MPRPIDNLESAFTEMYEFITDLPSGLDGFESDFDEAFKELENLKVAIAQPGKPLTLNQLRKMDGQPVWVEFIGHPDGTPIEPLWMLVNSREKRLVTEGWFAYSYPPAQQRWIKEANTPPTNGDHVRAMDNKELSKWLCSIMTGECCDMTCPGREFCEPGHKGLLDWLQATYKEEN